MITYTTNPEWPTIKFPKLHTVHYGKTDGNISAHYQRDSRDIQIDEWLRSNCKHPYYHSPGYMREKFIQFEDDEEAVAFALKWASS